MPRYAPSGPARLRAAVAGCVAALVSAPRLSAEPTVAEPVEPAPDVVLILVDDLGWAELGCYGNRFNETPHADRLAREGMVFTRAYSPAPVGLPARAALMTGQAPARLGVLDHRRSDTRWQVPREMLSLAELFQTAGYSTGIAGKWQLGGFKRGRPRSGPGVHGFARRLVADKRLVGAGSYFHPYTKVDPTLPARDRSPDENGSEYLVERVNSEASDFLSGPTVTPRFLFKSHYAVHAELVGKPDAVAHFKRKAGSGEGQHATQNNPHLAAMLRSIDDGLGQLLAAIDAAGSWDRTIIVFTSDNGGDGRYTTNGPLRGAKSQLYEGGLRVPLIVRWPGVTEAGSTSMTPVFTSDLFATFAEALSERPSARRPPQPIDAVSLLPLLRGEAPAARTLAWHYPRTQPHFLGGRSCDAISDGSWKLIEFHDDGHRELYHLTDDPGERNDLSATETAIVERLADGLESWRKAMTGDTDGAR